MESLVQCRGTAFGWWPASGTNLLKMGSWTVSAIQQVVLTLILCIYVLITGFVFTVGNYSKNFDRQEGHSPGDPWGHTLCIPTLLLSVLTAIFPGGPWSAGTRMSPFWIPFWILLELRTMEVVTTEAIRCAKLQSNCHHQQTNTQFFRFIYYTKFRQWTHR